MHAMLVHFTVGRVTALQIPDGKAPQKKLKAPSMSQRNLHMNGKPEVVVEADEEVMAANLP